MNKCYIPFKRSYKLRSEPLYDAYYKQKFRKHAIKLLISVNIFNNFRSFRT